MRKTRKVFLLSLLIGVLLLCITSCGNSSEVPSATTKESTASIAAETEELSTENDAASSADHAEEETSETEEMYITVTVNGSELTAKLEENSSAEAFYEVLREGKLTIDMSDYSNFEKVGALGFDLPTNDKDIRTKAGDIILYQGSNLVFYYDNNQWIFTKLGEFEDVTEEELREIFGEDEITAVISIRE